MKAIILTAFLLMSTNIMFAQDKNDTEVEIEEQIEVETNNDKNVIMTIDSILYPKTYPTPYNEGYWSEDGKAFLRAGFRFRSYVEFKQYMNTEISGFEIMESQEIELEGVLFLYQKKEQNRDGDIVEIVSYIKKNDENSVIEIGGFYPKGDELIYKLAIEKSAISAKRIKE